MFKYFSGCDVEYYVKCLISLNIGYISMFMISLPLFVYVVCLLCVG